MSCILRVYGKDLNIDSLLAIIDLEYDRVWRRGESRQASKSGGKRHDHSGMTFVASDADFSDFGQQVDETTNYLESYGDQIVIIASFEGVQTAVLDFGIELRDVAIHSDVLPLRFLRAAAEAGVSVGLSHYPCPDHGSQSEQSGGGGA